MSNGVAPGINGNANCPVTKELALGQLGLRCKKVESAGREFCETLPIPTEHQDHLFGHNYASEASQCDVGADEREEKETVEDSSRDEVAELEEDEAEQREGNCTRRENTFNKVYEEMKAMHVDENEDDDSIDFADNTDEDRDWDPYCEDAESEDSDVNPSSKSRRVVYVNGDYKRRKLNKQSHAKGAESKQQAQEMVSISGDKTAKHARTRCDFGGPVYYCTPCDRRYHTKTGFSQHKRFECGKSPAFQCLICKKEFKRKSSLKRHLRQIHKAVLDNNFVVHYDKLTSAPQHNSPSSVTSSSSTSGEYHARPISGREYRSQPRAMRVVRRQLFTGLDHNQ